SFCLRRPHGSRVHFGHATRLGISVERGHVGATESSVRAEAKKDTCVFDERLGLSEPSSERAMRGARLRRGLLIYAICLAAWVLVGLMYVGSDVARRLYWNIPHPWQESWFWSIRVLISTALTPLILWLGKRWPLERRVWPRRVAVHLLFGTLFSLVRAGLELAVHIPLNEPLGLGLQWVESLENATAVVLIFGFHEGVLAYWVILSVQSAYRFYEKY